jgi:hypothetical protein
MRLPLRSALASLVALLAVPATALAASEAGGDTSKGTDHTMPLMLGLIIFLMLALVVIGILEQRNS